MQFPKVIRYPDLENPNVYGIFGKFPDLPQILQNCVIALAKKNLFSRKHNWKKVATIGG